MAKTGNEKTSSNNSTLPYHRIVAKFGTSLLTDGSDHLNQEIMSTLAAQVAELHKQGRELLVVSSGAIAAGRYFETTPAIGAPSTLEISNGLATRL